ncbi:MAG TPA: hypothetical protein VFC72_00645 [Corynebacterium sp.]|nr:hypothetical protein [Corynebacterium sp.]
MSSNLFYLADGTVTDPGTTTEGAADTGLSAALSNAETSSAIADVIKPLAKIAEAVIDFIGLVV